MTFLSQISNPWYILFYRFSFSVPNEATFTMSFSPNNIVFCTWIVPNFRKCKSAADYPFTSNDGIKFRFQMNPKLVLPFFGSKYTTFALSLDFCKRDKVKLKHRVSIVNAKGHKCHTQETMAICKVGEWQAPCNILRKDLLDSKNGWLVDGTLTVRCEVELIDDNESENNFLAGDPNSMLNHFESLLASAKHSDVMLEITFDGDCKKFHAHKAILSARSTVFAAMFEHSDTNESHEERVQIEDIQIEVFELFLRYLYTGKLDSLDRFAMELLAAAHKYQIDCLKSICEQFIATKLTIENVTELLIHADMYQANVLRGTCIEYITDHSAEVMATEGWKVLSNKKHNLLSELFVNLIRKSSVC